jgi:hypothetical protein
MRKKRWRMRVGGLDTLSNDDVCIGEDGWVKKWVCEWEGRREDDDDDVESDNEKSEYKSMRERR